jgi:16S rRNA A1518/A1519 N6-dimethyltransferase RsmA/KsgA/DIM1 with predicted DNA glycosylase/AP lyase activity
MRPSRQGSGRPRRRDAVAPGKAGARPAPFRRKSLGQHHLRDGRVCRPLIDFLALAPGARVLEIGPGGGVLTRELLATGATVVALELDPAWAFELPKRVLASQDEEEAAVAEKEAGKTKNLRLGKRQDDGGPAAPAGAFEADVFPFDESSSVFRSLASASPASAFSILLGDALEFPWERLEVAWKVAGNLPYNVGTAIVHRLLAGARPGMHAAFLLQREVVDRIVARPGDDAYGALSVLVAARARAVRLGLVKPGAFVPPPKVESAFVGLETVVPPLPDAEMAVFERVVQAAFGQRRKSLRNALSAVYGRNEAASMLAAAGVDPRRRAEELGLEEFSRLSVGAQAPAG